MESYNLAEAARRLYQSGFNLFSIKTLRDVLGVKKESTFFSMMRRLIEGGVVYRLEKDTYALQDKNISDFLIANVLYIPSYVSFESALNFYGILPQFPYEMTSATTRKGKQKTIGSKTYSYTHIKRELFWGYRKTEWLMADPEKALLDQVYLWSKGLKTVHLDEYDLTSLSPKKIKAYLEMYPSTRQFAKATRELKHFMHI